MLNSFQRLIQVTHQADGISGGSEPISSEQSLDMDSAISALTGSNQYRQEIAKTEPEKAPELEVVGGDNGVVDLKTKESVGGKEEAEKVDPEPEDEDDWIEWAAKEEGQEGHREKLSDVIAGYDRASELESEVVKLRETTQETPAEYAQALEEVAQHRTDYIQNLSYIAKMMTPQKPSLDMMNPESANYNPDQYYTQMSKFEQDTQQMGQINQELGTKASEQRQYEDWALGQMLAREQQKLTRDWPEFQEPETKKGISDELHRRGFSEDEISQIADSRYMMIVKDLMEFSQMKAEQAKAVKHVRSKPKLVRGKARTNTKDTAHVNALKSLQSTGHVDDAVAAIRGLL